MLGALHLGSSRGSGKQVYCSGRVATVLNTKNLDTKICTAEKPSHKNPGPSMDGQLPNGSLDPAPTSPCPQMRPCQEIRVQEHGDSAD